MNKTQKEFDRSFCFTFYKSYYEQIMLVKENYGTEKAFEVFQSIAEYGLYQTEIVNKEILMLMGTTTVEAIDSSQTRRSNGFVQEDFKSTYAIVVYHRDHPEASQRTIATAIGVGKTKVQRVLAKIKESGLSIDDYIRDVITPNLNHNDNNNTNNNCIDQDQCDQRDQSLKSCANTMELADAQTKASTMPLKEFDFQSDSSFSNEDMARIISNFIKQGHNKTDVVTEFTNLKGWYKCSNEQAVIDCYDYLTKAD